MRLIIEPNYEQLSKWAANYVAAKIKAANPTAEKPSFSPCEQDANTPAEIGRAHV